MKVNASVASIEPAALPALIGDLEQAGCAGFYVAEIGQDPILTIASASSFATTLTLGTSVALAFPRGPTGLAYASHYLAEATRGRFVLGLGAQVPSHMRRRFGLAPRPPVAAMRDLLRAWHAVWDSWESGRPLDFRGDYYQLSLMPPDFRPRHLGHGRPKVFLGAVGPKMAEVAGELADGLFLHSFSTPAYVQHVIIPAVGRGLDASGRPAAAFEVCYSAFVAHGSGPSEIRSRREAVRAQVGFYASTPAYRNVLECHGFGDLQPVLRKATVEDRWDELSRGVPDELLDLFCIAGDPGEIAGQILERWSPIVDQVSLPADLWRACRGDQAWGRALAALAVDEPRSSSSE